VRIFVFDDLLSSDSAARLRSLLTAGVSSISQVAVEITQALRDHPLVGLGLQPRRLSAPVFQLREAGAGIVPTVSDAILGDEDKIRADAGIIVALSASSEYDGGEVLIDTGSGEERITVDAGGCVIYPSWARCGLAPVTRGIRWTAEIQVQSFVRGAQEREILYEIGYSLHLLRLFSPPHDPDVARLETCSQNLLRILAEF
jgi:PKHD-type hydroxylase